MRLLRRSELVALAPAVALAAAVRLVGVGYGLPLPLLDPDEQNIVPRAWRVVHDGAFDPGFYDYPSLLIYLVAPLQAFVDAPSYGAARAVAVGVGLAGVAAAWWLGRRSYGLSAAVLGALAVAVATTHVAYSRVAVTDVLLTLAVTCALALAVTGRLEWAGAAAGLAASAKYPGALLALPLVVAGWGTWRRLALAAALGIAAFAATSPFVLVNAGEAGDDLRRVSRLAREGWLGFEDDPWTPVAFLDRLWEALGPFLVLGLAGLVWALVRRRRQDLVLASFALAWWLHLMPLEAHFDRYVLPLVPVLGVLAGALPPLLPVGAVLLAVPLAWSIGDARELTRTDTRERAASWIAVNVPRDARIAADPSTLPLRDRDVVRLELPGPGRAFDARRDLGRLRAEGVAWLIVSGAVADRVLAAGSRYPREAAFYEALSHRRAAFTARPDASALGGPWVGVYRLR